MGTLSIITIYGYYTIIYLFVPLIILPIVSLFPSTYTLGTLPTIIVSAIITCIVILLSVVLRPDGILIGTVN